MTRRIYLTYRSLVLWTVAWIVIVYVGGRACGLPSL